MATPEERTARDTSECLKDKVEALIGQIEKALSTTPISMSALQKRIKSAETAWTKFEDQYDELRAIAVKGRTQDQVRTEQDREQYAAFQLRYLEVHARTGDALDIQTERRRRSPQRAQGCRRHSPQSTHFQGRNSSQRAQERRRPSSQSAQSAAV